VGDRILLSGSGTLHWGTKLISCNAMHRLPIYHGQPQPMSSCPHTASLCLHLRTADHNLCQASLLYGTILHGSPTSPSPRTTVACLTSLFRPTDSQSPLLQETKRSGSSISSRRRISLQIGQGQMLSGAYDRVHNPLDGWILSAEHRGIYHNYERHGGTYNIDTTCS